MTRAWDRGWLRAPEGFDVVHSVSLAAPMLRRGSRSRARRDRARRGLAPASRRHHAPGEALARAGAPAGGRQRPRALVVPSRLVAADLEAEWRGSGPAGAGARRHRSRGRPRSERHGRPVAPGRGVRRVPPDRGHARAAEERGPARACLRAGAALVARALAAGHRRPVGLGAGARPPSARRRRRLHRRGLRPGPGRAVPAGPRLRLRPADGGLRPAPARGDAHGDAVGGGQRGAERARPGRDRGAARLHRRSARHRRHRPRPLGRPDRRRPAGRSGGARVGLRARPAPGRPPPASTSRSGAGSDDRAARPLARRVRGARTAGRRRLLHHGDSPPAWPPGRTWRSTLLSRRDDEARWTGLAPGARRARPRSRRRGPARLAFEQVGLPVVAALVGPRRPSRAALHHAAAGRRCPVR